MSFDSIERLNNGPVPLYLAPQAGVSESPFRRLCRRFGADVLVSEFVSAAGIVMNSKRSREYLRFDEAERPIGIQIFGADAAVMADAAAFVADTYAPDFIDINFGCPVKKVVRRNGGSGCLRDLDLVETIIRAVDDATSVTTTVKIRSGFNEVTRDPVAIGLRCEQAGARAICLHPRTRTDMYSGEARWDHRFGASVGNPSDRKRGHQVR
jgi:tRNA-dihydrouridine synthase B